MHLKVVRLFTLVGIPMLGLTSLAHANPITTPAGLTPGESYRLVFITSGTTTGSSTDVSTYNAFAQSQADSNAALAALDLTWTAIASTTTVNAIDNIGVEGLPVYNLDGQLVASNDGTGAGGLWSSAGILAPIEYDENGNVEISGVFTGTDTNGTVDPSNPFGSSFKVEQGYSASYGAGNETWVQYTHDLATNEYPIYAISTELTYDPGSVPEPGTISLMMLGGAFLAGKMRKKFGSGATEN